MQRKQTQKETKFASAGAKTDSDVNGKTKAKTDSDVNAELSDKYKVLEVLGEGTYGKVYKVVRDQKEYAIKRFLNPAKCDKIHGVLAVRELDFVARLNSPFINNAVEFIYGMPFTKSRTPVKGMRDDKVHIVLPLALYSGHDLRKREHVSYIQLKRFMYQLLQGLYYMHTHNICHRDIKPGNILIFNVEQSSNVKGLLCAKWTDFGMCKHLTSEDKNSTHVSTSIYKPPELLMRNENYTFNFDIWSLGCTFYELVAREDLFDGRNDKEILRTIFKIRGTPTLEGFKELTGDDPMFTYKSLSKSKKKSLAKIISFDESEINDFNNNTTINYESHSSNKDSNNSNSNSNNSDNDNDDKDIVSSSNEEINDNEKSKETLDTRRSMLPNFGTFDEFLDLLDKMLQVIPSKRYTTLECLQHPFFANIPLVDPTGEWCGLTKQLPLEIDHHVINKIKNKQARSHGIDVIKHINTNFSENTNRIIFLGLDIYDRCLLSIEKDLQNKQSIPNAVETNNEPIITNSIIITITNNEPISTKIKKKDIVWPVQGKEPNKYNYRLLAACACYLACKYFMDEETPRLTKIFPTMKFVAKEIEVTEKLILEQYIQYKIYRPTIYDSLHKKLAPEKLFALLMDEDEAYGFTINETANIWMDQLK